MKKHLILFIGLLFIPLTSYAGSISISPTIGADITEISITSLNSPDCSSDCGFIVYDSDGNALGGDYAGSVSGSLPYTLSTFSNVLNGGSGGWVSIGTLTSLPDGIYTIIYFDWNGTNSGACTEVDYPNMSSNNFSTCIGGWDVQGAYTTFQLGAGGGGSGSSGSTTTSTTTALLGSINFGLAIIITIMSIALSAFIFNIYNKRRKPWQK